MGVLLNHPFWWDFPLRTMQLHGATPILGNHHLQKSLERHLTEGAWCSTSMPTLVSDTVPHYRSVWKPPKSHHLAKKKHLDCIAAFRHSHITYLLLNPSKPPAVMDIDCTSICHYFWMVDQYTSSPSKESSKSPQSEASKARNRRMTAASFDASWLQVKHFVFHAGSRRVLRSRSEDSWPAMKTEFHEHQYSGAP